MSRPDVALIEQHPDDQRFWRQVRHRLAGPGHDDEPLLIAMPTTSEDKMGNSDVGFCVRCNDGVWVPERAKFINATLIISCMDCYKRANDEVTGRVGIA